MSPFEAIRHSDEIGYEYWSARELMVVLDYRTWLKFKRVIEKAQEACENSGHAASDHMFRVEQMITIGKGGQRKVEDFHLSRYACYLIVQNADPEKPIVALGQTYFAAQTRQAELANDAEREHPGGACLRAIAHPGGTAAITRAALKWPIVCRGSPSPSLPCSACCSPG